jgi:hypothetical protein
VWRALADLDQLVVDDAVVGVEDDGFARAAVRRGYMRLAKGRHGHDPQRSSRARAWHP